jgi:hypothetical protein
VCRFLSSPFRVNATDNDNEPVDVRDSALRTLYPIHPPPLGKSTTRHPKSLLAVQQTALWAAVGIFGAYF